MNLQSEGNGGRGSVIGRLFLVPSERRASGMIDVTAWDSMGDGCYMQSVAPGVEVHVRSDGGTGFSVASLHDGLAVARPTHHSTFGDAIGEGKRLVFREQLAALPH